MIRKVKSENGATIIVGLLFFLMCAIVGSIILTAATVASGRISRIHKDSQDEYTLSSASQLIYDTLLSSKFSCKLSGGFIDDLEVPSANSIMVTNIETTIKAMVQHVYKENVFPELKSYIEDNPNVKEVIVTKRGNSANVLVADASALISDVEEVLTISLILSNDFTVDDKMKELLKDVAVDITIYNNFDIRVDVKLIDDDGVGGREFSIWYYATDITASVTKQKKSVDDDDLSTYLNTFSVSWPSAKMNI